MNGTLKICQGSVEVLAIANNQLHLMIDLPGEFIKHPECNETMSFIKTKTDNAIHYLMAEGFIPMELIGWNVFLGVVSKQKQ